MSPRGHVSPVCIRASMAYIQMNVAPIGEVSFETREQSLVRAKDELEKLKESLWSALKAYLFCIPGSLEEINKLKQTIQLHKRYISFLER